MNNTNISNIYSIYDDAIGAYGPLFEAPTHEDAIRSLSHHLASSGDSLLSFAPQHYTLRHLATKDNVTGVITGLSSADFVASVPSLLPAVSRSRASIEEASGRHDAQHHSSDAIADLLD